MTKRSPHRWSPCRRCNDSFPEGAMFIASVVDPLRWKRGLLCRACREVVLYNQNWSEMDRGRMDAEGDVV